MIVVINLNPLASTRSGTRRLVAALQRVAPAGTRVLERHYRRLTPQSLASLAPMGVVLGPQGVPFDAYPGPSLEAMFGLIRSLDRPTLGVCGGHQALALAYGGRVAPVLGGRTASGSYAGMEKLVGLFEVALDDDPLTEGLNSPATFYASHVEGVTVLPDGFEVIGRGDPCLIQMMRMSGRPVWSTQFHPELGGDGAALLQRFVSVIAQSGH